jgi:hypothetical protein
MMREAGGADPKAEPPAPIDVPVMHDLPQGPSKPEPQAPPPPLPPQPPEAGGLIMGGSVLTSFGSALTFAGLIGCAVVCGGEARYQRIFIPLSLVGAGSLGGGIAMQTIGFRRMDAALDYEVQHGVHILPTTRRVWASTLLGGMFAGSIFGLIGGSVTSAKYARRLKASRARMRAHVSTKELRLGAGIWSEGTALSLSGRF